MHIVENGLIAEFLRQTLHVIAELAGHGSLINLRDEFEARYVAVALKKQGSDADYTPIYRVWRYLTEMSAQNTSLSLPCIGAVVGGLIGSEVAGRGNGTEGAIVGALVGGVAGAALSLIHI